MLPRRDQTHAPVPDAVPERRRVLREAELLRSARADVGLGLVRFRKRVRVDSRQRLRRPRGSIEDTDEAREKLQGPLRQIHHHPREP